MPGWLSASFVNGQDNVSVVWVTRQVNYKTLLVHSTLLRELIWNLFSSAYWLSKMYFDQDQGCWLVSWNSEKCRLWDNKNVMTTKETRLQSCESNSENSANKVWIKLGQLFALSFIAILRIVKASNKTVSRSSGTIKPKSLPLHFFVPRNPEAHLSSN